MKFNIVLFNYRAHLKKKIYRIGRPMAKFRKFWDDDNNNNRDDDISQTLQIYVAVAEFVLHYLIDIS